MKRILFLCDKPHQIFNTLNLVWHAKNFSAPQVNIDPSDSIDLYIVKGFNENEAKTLSDRLKHTGLFKNVWLISTSPVRNWAMISKAKAIWLKMLHYYYSLFPKKLFSVMTNGEIPISSYDVIYMTYASYEPPAFLKLNPKAKLIFFEDGLGNYTVIERKSIIRSLLHSLSVLRYRIAYKIMGWGLYYADRIECLYLNNVPMCKNTSIKDIRAMPKLDKEFLNFANGVFSLDETSKIKKKIVWLTRSNDKKRRDFLVCKETMERNIVPYKDDVLVRIHPRETNWKHYEELGFEVDIRSKLWELIVLQQDVEDKILLCTYSTAQVIPKMLYDKEPFLIFTYPMDSSWSENEVEGMNNIVQMVKESYRQSEKVVLVKSEDELRRTIEKFYTEVQK